MRKAYVVATLIAISTSSYVPAAHAGGGDVAAGLVGGLIGGAIIGGAIAHADGPPPPPPPPAAYYAPPPPPPETVYVEEPEPCHWAQERSWDGYAWRIRRVQVCN